MGFKYCIPCFVSRGVKKLLNLSRAGGQIAINGFSSSVRRLEGLCGGAKTLGFRQAFGFGLGLTLDLAFSSTTTVEASFVRVVEKFSLIEWKLITS